MRATRLVALMCALWWAPGALAQSVRPFRPIAAPSAPPVEGAERLTEIHPIGREAIEDALRMLFDAWNSGRLEAHLADDFYDRTRLADAMIELPRDAKVRLVAVQGFRTLDQYARDQEQGVKEVISNVEVTARTQIEFTDPALGFRRLDGTNRYVLQITELWRPSSPVTP